MSAKEYFELARVIVVIALVVYAAVLATPPNKVPLALRGLMKIMKRDGAIAKSSAPSSVPVWKKILSFVIVILAFVLAKI